MAQDGYVILAESALCRLHFEFSFLNVIKHQMKVVEVVCECFSRNNYIIQVFEAGVPW